MARPADPKAKDALISAARAEFMKKGIRAARIEDITAACKLSKGAFYLHFHSKEALFGELVVGFKSEMERINETRVERLKSFLDTHGALTARDVEKRTSKYEELLSLEAEEDLRVLEVLWDYRDVTSVLISGSQATEFEGLIWHIVDREVQRCSGIFEKFQHTGSCRTDVDPQLLGSMIVGTYLLVGKQMSSAKEKPDLASLALTLQRLLREGCAKKASTRSPVRNTLMGSYKKVLALALMVVTASSVLTACSEKAQAQPPIPAAPAPSVSLVPTREVDVTAKEEVTGSLYPAQALQLGFEVAGRLERVYVRKGDKVKAGQLLGHLKSDMVEARLAQAQAHVAAARAAAAMASDVAKRNAKLQEQGSVSDIQNRNTQSSAKQAAAQLLVAKATLAQEEADKKRHDLRAPFDGTIIDAPEQSGATVGAGVALFTLEQLDTLVLKSTLAEKTRAGVKVGSKVKVDSVGGEASSDAATVRAILPSADTATRRIPVEITVPNLDARFVAHTLARAVLVLGVAQKAEALPATALISTGGDHVLTLGPSGEVKSVPVEVLERAGQEVVVRAPSPLKQVVDYPSAELTEGVKVSAK